MSDESSDILPPIDERLRSVVNTVYPRVLRVRERVSSVRFATDADEKRLLSLRNKRVLILPNHPTDSEPPVVYNLSRLLGESFRYAAMDELFTGAIGAIVARLGAFPIKRGLPDRQALKRCQESLLLPGGKLVLFAEGETHGQNDYLLPLNPGAAQIAFWTIDKLHEREGNAADLLIEPIAIKYQYIDTVQAAAELEFGLCRVEENLGIEPRNDEPLYPRIRNASRLVLAGIEREYDLPQDDSSNTDNRLTRLYSALEERIVSMLRIMSPRETTIVQRMRTLFNAAFAYRHRMENGKTRYEQRLQERREWIADACLADLRRVENFLGVRTNRIEPDATLEQLGEMLIRLETEIYGEKRTRPMREAIIKIGNPMTMVGWTTAYRVNKRQAVADLTGEIEAQIRTMLLDLRQYATLVAPNP